MRAQVVVENGPQAGATYELPDGEAVLGREDGCTIPVPDEQASRRHARILARDGAFHLEDLESKNGTFLNGLPVQKAPLKWGDRVRVGSTSLLFIFFRDEKAGTARDEFRIVRDATASTVMDTVRMPTAPAPPRRRGGPDAAAMEQAAEFGRLIHDFHLVIRTAKDPRRVPEGFLRKILAAVPAERIAIFLLSEPGPALSAHTRIARAADRSDPPIPEALLVQAAREGRGLLARQRIDTPNGKGAPREPAGTDAARAARTYWIACAPLHLPDGTEGVLYADTYGSEKVLLKDDLRHLTLAAPFIALALQAALPPPAPIPQAAASPEEDDLIGTSPAFREVLRTVSAVAPTDTTVLIHGESGTGKELVARAVHRGSPRRDGPFVAVNCGAIPKDLMESDLFGHERGAFTGAHARRIGCFERAHRGTLFLDEIGELSPECQVKLLRALESRAIQRVGGGEEVPVDLRILAATNQDLETAVRRGAFRNDLYFRIRVLEVSLPPLRERPEDIPTLVDYHLDRFARKLGKRLRGLDGEASRLLREYPWPGNIRELKNAVERAVVLCRGEQLGAGDFSFLRPGAEPAAGKPLALREVERQAILVALKATGWNKTAAAEALGIDRTTLYEKLRAYGLAPEKAGA